MHKIKHKKKRMPKTKLKVAAVSKTKLALAVAFLGGAALAASAASGMLDRNLIDVDPTGNENIIESDFQADLFIESMVPVKDENGTPGVTMMEVTVKNKGYNNTNKSFTVELRVTEGSKMVVAASETIKGLKLNESKKVYLPYSKTIELPTYSNEVNFDLTHVNSLALVDTNKEVEEMNEFNNTRWIGGTTVHEFYLGPVPGSKTDVGVRNFKRKRNRVRRSEATEFSYEIVNYGLKPLSSVSAELMYLVGNVTSSGKYPFDNVIMTDLAPGEARTVKRVLHPPKSEGGYWVIVDAKHKIIENNEKNNKSNVIK